MVVYVAGVGVVVPHEGFDTPQNGLFRVAEFISQNPLETEGQDVVSLVMIVERIADPVEKVEGVLEFASRQSAEDAARDEFGHRAGSGLGVDNPFEIMVVAQGAGAFLDIGFLKKDGMRPLGVASSDVEAPFFEEGFLVLFDAGFPEAGAEVLKELGGASDESSREKGGP